MTKTEQTKVFLCDMLSIMPGVSDILKRSKQDLKIESKEGVSNFVTNVDKALEDFITKTLKGRYPNSVVIGEETSMNLSEEELNSPLKFVVDPLDGTTNYTNGWPHSVSIGVIWEDELVAGVVFDVLSDRVYFAQKGQGAHVTVPGDIMLTVALEDYFEDPSDLENVGHIQPYARDYNDICKSVISYDTPYGEEAYFRTQAMASELYKRGASLKTVGPISLDVVKTACGPMYRKGTFNHAVWHMEVRPWDLAAATCILRETGGEIIDKATGEPLSIETLSDPSRKIGFFASGNPELALKLQDTYEQVFGTETKELGPQKVLTPVKRA